MNFSCYCNGDLNYGFRDGIINQFGAHNRFSGHLLREGSRGPAVDEVQRILGVDPRTGYFGPITKAAVQQLQREYGLTPDGIVGPKTWAALDIVSQQLRFPIGP